MGSLVVVGGVVSSAQGGSSVPSYSPVGGPVMSVSSSSLSSLLLNTNLTTCSQVVIRLHRSLPLVSTAFDDSVGTHVTFRLSLLSSLSSLLLKTNSVVCSHVGTLVHLLGLGVVSLTSGESSLQWCGTTFAVGMFTRVLSVVEVYMISLT